MEKQILIKNFAFEFIPKGKLGASNQILRIGQRPIQQHSDERGKVGDQISAREQTQNCGLEETERATSFRCKD